MRLIRFVPASWSNAVPQERILGGEYVGIIEEFDMLELKDVVAPKWMMYTKRGWGMLIAGLAAGLPAISWWLESKGIHIDLPMIKVFGEAVSNAMDSIGLVIGFGLWFWGSMRPSAPLTVFPPSAAPMPPGDTTKTNG
jgi:hypothetical protein